MIEIKNMKKVFDNSVVALAAFNITIQDGEFIALLGPSGCGKSTTLNCIAGLLDPTEGQILFDGTDVTKWAPKDRNIGMVFQSYALYPHLAIIDNIAFPLKQKGVDKATRQEKARAVARKLQIEHLLARKPAQLSGGQQQRVAMCRAIVKEPKYLLLDEPMSNLDARLKIEIREVIKRIQQELGVTAILVTHDQEEAMALADRIAILDGGKIQQFDTPDMLYEHPANLFVANFMGNPPMNFLEGQLVGGKYIEIGDERIPLDVKLSCVTKDLPIKVGVRSHQLDLSFVKEGKTQLSFVPRIVENLGKELLVYGSIGKENVRITYHDKSQMPGILAAIKGKETLYVSFGTSYQVFSLADGNNLVEGIL